MNCPSVNSPEDVVQPGAVCNDIQISDEQSPPMKKKQKLDKACADSTVSHPMLPPCRICGQKASGFHYGANTCEACKV